MNIAEVDDMEHVVDCAHGESAKSIEREAFFDINCLYPVAGGNVEHVHMRVAKHQQVASLTACKWNRQYQHLRKKLISFAKHLQTASGIAGYMISFSLDFRP